MTHEPDKFNILDAKTVYFGRIPYRILEKHVKTLYLDEYCSVFCVKFTPLVQPLAALLKEPFIMSKDIVYGTRQGRKSPLLTVIWVSWIMAMQDGAAFAVVE